MVFRKYPPDFPNLPLLRRRLFTKSFQWEKNFLIWDLRQIFWSGFPLQNSSKIFRFFSVFFLCLRALCPGFSNCTWTVSWEVSWPFCCLTTSGSDILDLTQLGHPEIWDLIWERSLCSHWSGDGKEGSWHSIVCYIWRDMSEAGKRNVCVWKSFSLSTLLWNSLIFTW